MSGGISHDGLTTDEATATRGDQLRTGEGADEGLRSDVVVKGPASVARLLLELDEQWPILRFLGFGCYYAWIWLCYSSSMLVPPSGAEYGWGNTTFVMYLLSTTALSVMLVLSALFEKRFASVMRSNAAVLALSSLATVSTLLVHLFVPLGATNPIFMVGCVLTGVGTAGVALRLGMVYSTVPPRRVLMYTASSFMFAAGLYFVVIGVPPRLGLVLMALLPVIAVMFTMTASDGFEGAQLMPECPRKLQKMPRGFFVRLVLGVSVLSVIAGITHGYSALESPASVLDLNGRTIVAVTGFIAIVIFVLAAARGENFDYVRLYYPIILLLVAGLLIAPLLGGRSTPFGAVFVGVAYACFIMVVWCLLAQTAYSTGMSPLRVFGIGRGASAAGTTIGWLFGLALVDAQSSSLVVSVSIASVFVLLMVSLFVLNDTTIGSVLHMHDRRAGWRSANSVAIEDGADRGVEGDGIDESVEADGASSGSQGPVTTVLDELFDEPQASNATLVAARQPIDALESIDALSDDIDVGRRRGMWARKCDALCDTYRLSERERDVLFLLAKGRSISYIAEYLHVSFNTSKSHIRHVYVKTGVHTRQELLDLVEKTEI